MTDIPPLGKYVDQMQEKQIEAAATPKKKEDG